MARGSAPGLQVPLEGAPHHSQAHLRSSRYSHKLFQLHLTPEMRQKGGNRQAGWELLATQILQKQKPEYNKGVHLDPPHRNQLRASDAQERTTTTEVPKEAGPERCWVAGEDLLNQDCCCPKSSSQPHHGLLCSMHKALLQLTRSQSLVFLVFSNILEVCALPQACFPSNLLLATYSP